MRLDLLLQILHRIPKLLAFTLKRAGAERYKASLAAHRHLGFRLCKTIYKIDGAGTEDPSEGARCARLTLQPRGLLRGSFAPPSVPRAWIRCLPAPTAMSPSENKRSVAEEMKHTMLMSTGECS
ncbi:hypothetical protein SUGI_0129050 [Cryptomeria japonica]|nr:hypothetical protein SUGI_0129050 [Cryptomeria japonica]